MMGWMESDGVGLYEALHLGLKTGTDRLWNPEVWHWHNGEY
jgi:hypothetical protein